MQAACNNERAIVEFPNVSIGKSTHPTQDEPTAILGASAEAWNQLIAWMATEQNVTGQEWKSSSPNFGWSLPLKLKKRTIPI
jgi:hypothetical protein